MTMKQQELYNVITSLPEELSNKVIDYIEYLKFTYNVNRAPENLVIKDNEDLLTKLQKGKKDADKGKVCSVEEAFAEVEEILST